MREIGIRMALGAQRRDIVRLIVRPGLGLAVGGVVAGIVSAAFLARLMSTVLFAVTPTDADDVRVGIAAADPRGAGGLLRAGAPGDEAGPADRAAHG